jgi:iron complex outermembrane recepter protein
MVCTLTHAQGPEASEGQPSSAPQTPSDSNGGLAEIVVTAERRTERLVDVPASVVAQSGEALQSAGITRFQDLGLVTPDVQIGNSGTYNQPTIRGISTTFAAGGQESNVAVYVDGFYTSDQLAINQDLVNIQDIQILKGPQGTLYGRNATGGAILINTLTPGRTFEARATASYASFDDRSIAAYVAGPVAEGLSLGVAGYFHESEGYIHDVNDFAPDAPIRFTGLARRGSRYAAPFENYSIRPKLVFDSIDSLKITAGFAHTFVSDARALAFTTIGNRVNSAPSYDGYVTTTAQDQVSQNFTPVSEITTDEPNLTAEFRLGDIGTLTSRSAYRWQRNFQMYDLDGSPLDPIDNPFGTSYSAVLRESRHTFTQQLDLSVKPVEKFDVLAGLFYYRDTYIQRGIEDLGLPFSPTTDYFHLHTQSWAAYVDGTLEVRDGLFLTAGGRYSNDKKDYSATRRDSDGDVLPTQSTIGYYADGVPRIDNSAFTPRANLRYNLTPGSNVYFSWSRGFKSATINSYAPYNLLKPERATSYEIGYKTASRGTRAEIAAFYEDFKDNQVSALTANSQSVQTVIENSGGARIYGVDALFNWQVDDHLSLQSSAAYLHARYRDFDNATNVIVDPVSGLNTSVVGSWTGRRLARAPDWTASVGAEYDLHFAGGLTAFNVTGKYSSRYAPLDSSYGCNAVETPTGPVCPSGLDTASAPGRFEQGGFFQGNLQGSWTDPSDHWTFTLFCDNVTDVRYKVFNQGFFYATIQGLSQPRTFGGRLGLRF